MKAPPVYCQNVQRPAVSRRDWLRRSAMGFGALALPSLLAEQGALGSVPGAPTGFPHFAPKAKRVIFLFMHGGPSAVDTFDYKPDLIRDSGKPLPFDKPRVQFAQTGNLLQSPFHFRQHGQCGRWVSSLFPEVGALADELCFVHSLYGSNEAHGGALLKVHTGSDTFVRPSMGAWVSYGLGSENRSLPSFITIEPTLGHGGVQNFGSAFLPAIHQGTRIAARSGNGTLSIPNLQPGAPTLRQRRTELNLTQALNREQLERVGADAALEAKIASMELAFRMQMEAPEIFELAQETKATRALYGIDEQPTDSFGRRCLLARRLAESGVRFVQVSHRYWDQHSNLESQHSKLAAEVDRPIAGLLKDLKARGLLEDTLVLWGGEFGRTPTAQGKDGRDHNPHAFTWWFAGAGFRPGYARGRSDAYGYYAQSQRMHVHDLHATLLHALGLDHERLTFRHAGRDFRLTDVEGNVAHDMFV